MFNVLVTGVGSNIGQGIIKSLRMTAHQLKVIGTDINPLAAGLYRCDKGYLVPPATNKQFISKIIEICNTDNIDLILIGSDAEIPVLSKNISLIESESKAKVIVSQSELIDNLIDKWKLSQLLKDGGLNYPKSILPDQTDNLNKFIQKYGFPLIVKPRHGAGSRGVSLAKTTEELQFLIKHTTNPVIQEQLGTQYDEYTAGIFYSLDSSPKGIIVFRRELSSGTTYRAISDDFPLIEKEVQRAATLLTKYKPIGPINIQMRLHHNEPVIFEINPRFSGTTVFRAKLGFNEADAIINNYLLGQDINKLNYSKGIMMRYFEEIYIDINEFNILNNSKCIINPSSEIYKLL